MALNGKTQDVTYKMEENKMVDLEVAEIALKVIWKQFKYMC